MHRKVTNVGPIRDSRSTSMNESTRYTYLITKIHTPSCIYVHSSDSHKELSIAKEVHYSIIHLRHKLLIGIFIETLKYRKIVIRVMAGGVEVSLVGLQNRRAQQE